MAIDVLERGQVDLGLSTGSGLLAAARRQDPEAWERLVDQYSALIYHWCKLDGLTQSDAADVMQTVMMKLSQHLGRFEKDGRKASFRRWLATVTRNCIRDYRRAQQGRPQALGGTDALSRLQRVPDSLPEETGSSVGQSDRSRELRRLMDEVQTRVKETTWQAFRLTELDGLTSPEAGQRLGMSAAAVRLAKARVLQHLRELSTDGLMGGVQE